MNTEAKYKAHPAANLFPMMPPDQYKAFKEDIRQNGFQESVTLYKGQILDGRNRYKAAIELNMLDDLPIAEMDDDTDIDPYQWVISRNLYRRHLNESQRGMVAAKLAKLAKGKAGNGRVEVSIETPTLAKAAEQLQVGRATVARAKTVLANGSQELIESVERGEVAVSKAAQQVKKPNATKGLQIDSGPLEATDKFEQVPKDKWRTLMRAKRDFLARRVSYDCRCLVEFCEEAELVYADCGFTSAAEMIQHGFELDTMKIELAIALLLSFGSFDYSKIDDIVAAMKDKET